MIETLPLLTPDARRGARTRARCHERLARQRMRADGPAARATRRYLAAERALIGGLGIVYISSVAFIAIWMLSGG